MEEVDVEIDSEGDETLLVQVDPKRSAVRTRPTQCDPEVGWKA